MNLFHCSNSVWAAVRRPFTKTNACPPAAFLRFAPLLLAVLAPLAALRAQSNYATPYTFTTLAGLASAGSTDGTGSATRFSAPGAVAVDSLGNLYVADTHNNLVRKVTPGGVVTTLAGSIGSVGSVDGAGSAAQFYAPQGIAVDGAGNLYVADTDNLTVRKVTPTVVSGVTNWVVTTIAGSAGKNGFADGTGSDARFYNPYGVAVDPAGNLYVADRNTIRQITPTVVGGITNWVVTTLAGNGYDGSADGTGSDAQFDFPHGIALDGAGNLYVSDAYNAMIRKVTPTVVSGVTTWVVTTLAGSAGNWGSADGTGSAASFNQLQGVAADSAGNVYAADHNSIRQITPAGVVTTITGTDGGSADGTGSAAQFSWPQGVAVDSAGNLYVADTDNNTIRQITPNVVSGVTNWVVTTIAGSADSEGFADGTGSAARFSYPAGAAVDSVGNVYVGDTGYATIRQITPAGVVTTIAGYHYGWGGSTDGTGSEARFADPYGVAVDKSGNLYVADTTNDTIRKITPTVVNGVTNWVVTTLAGSAGNSGSFDATGTAALFNWPRGVAVDGVGNVYVTDTGNDTIRKITAAGVVTTLAGSAGNRDVIDGTGTAAQFNGPTGMAIDGAGNLYVTDDGCLVRKITSAGVVTTIAGSHNGYGGFADGTGSAAQFKDLQGIAADGAGDLYIADTGNNLIRKITPTVVNGVTNWVVTTLAGVRSSIGSTDGTGRAVQFQYPEGIAADNAGNVYVVDTNNNTIRKGVPTAGVPPSFTAQPTGQTVTAGGNTSFTAAASGTPTPTYHWQVSTNGGSTWTNLADTAPYSGTATGTLTITAATAAMNGYHYLCLASNSVQSNVASNAALLTVNAPPAFTTQPNGQTVTAGGNTSFTAAASGTPAPTYQWQVSTNGGNTWTNLTNTAPYGGTTTGTLTITAATAAMNGYHYLCLASNSVQSNVASNAAILGVIPSAATADAGEDVISSGFTVAWNAVSGARGYRLDVSTDSSFGSFVAGYQNLDVGNVTSVTISSLSASTTYYYRVRAYDSAGTSSNSSTIAVTTSATIAVTTPLIVSTLAGQPLTRGDSDGAGSAARFFYPSGIATDNAGNIYLADTDNHTIRKVVASTGAVTTLAGLAGNSGDADGTGSAARFNNPSGVAADSAGNVYVADTMNNTLRMVTPQGVVSTLAGLAETPGSADGTGGTARFQGPQGLAIDTSNNLYVVDTNNHTIRKVVTSTGVVTTVAGLAGNSGSADGLSSQGRFNHPSGVAADGTGNLYVADTENHTIRQILPSGMVNTVAGSAGNSGGADGTGSAARFDSPSDLAVDSSGNVYVADTDNFTIREVVPSTGAVTTLAGLAGTSGSTDGLGSAVRFYHPAGLAMDSSSNLYVADTDNQTVRVGMLAIKPTIQTQPQSQTVTAGNSVQFSVTASGRPAVAYQWYLNGAAISGATSSSYSLSSAQSSNAGNYTVVVSNTTGSVTSNQATLTVNAVTQPSGHKGGGAPSGWFYGALFLLVAGRVIRGCTRIEVGRHC